MRSGLETRVPGSRTATWTGTSYLLHLTSRPDIQGNCIQAVCVWMTRTPPQPSTFVFSSYAAAFVTGGVIYDSNSPVQTGHTPDYMYFSHPSSQPFPPLHFFLYQSPALSLSAARFLGWGDWLSQQWCLVYFWCFWNVISVSRTGSASSKEHTGEV